MIGTFCADASLFVQDGLFVQSPAKSVNPFKATASKRHNSGRRVVRVVRLKANPPYCPDGADEINRRPTYGNRLLNCSTSR